MNKVKKKCLKIKQNCINLVETLQVGLGHPLKFLSRDSKEVLQGEGEESCRKRNMVICVVSEGIWLQPMDP